jgi:hypothetical protein
MVRRSLIVSSALLLIAIDADGAAGDDGVPILILAKDTKGTRL